MNIKTARIALLTGLALILTGSVAAQPAQSHPLSQIIPIDTDLDMSGYEIGNSSQITLDEGSEPEGLVLDDLTITHEGRAQRLVLDYQNNQWSIENSDLALNGNNISGFFSAPCNPGRVMADISNSGSFGCVDATGEVQEDFVSRNGDSMNGTLDMANYDLIGLNRLATSGNGITVTDSANSLNLIEISENGNVNLVGGDLGGVRNLRFADSSNTNQYTMVYDGTNSRLTLSNAGEDIIRIDDSTNNLILPGGGLDMRGSNIVNFFGSACASGNVMVQVNSDGTFDCVDATGEVQEDFVSRSGDTMLGTLDMNGNAVSDTTGTLTLGGGNVEVATGNLNMNSGNVNNVNTVNNGGATLNTGGSVNVGSGTVTSSSKMCIGDQC